MTRIKPEDMATLQSASDVKAIAETAVSELEEMSVAHCINEAANTGEYSAVYSKPISAALRTKLEGQGYTLSAPAPLAKSGDVTNICWKAGTSRSPATAPDIISMPNMSTAKPRRIIPVSFLFELFENI